MNTLVSVDDLREKPDWHILYDYDHPEERVAQTHRVRYWSFLRFRMEEATLRMVPVEDNAFRWAVSITTPHKEWRGVARFSLNIWKAEARGAEASGWAGPNTWSSFRLLAKIVKHRNKAYKHRLKCWEQEKHERTLHRHLDSTKALPYRS